MRLFVLIFGIVGLGMGLADYFVIRMALDFRDGAIVTEGEVIDFNDSRSNKGGTMYSPRVRYWVPAAEGGMSVSHEINGSVRSSSRSYDIGDKVQVLYRPELPGSGRINSFLEQWFVVSIFSVFALVFGGVALALVVGAIQRKRIYAWLEHSGMTVQAKIIEVGKNTNLKINGRSPWVVRAQWQHPVTQQVHVFQSDNLWFDPSPFVGKRIDTPVRVDADQPRRYRIDLSWLPKLA